MPYEFFSWIKNKVISIIQAIKSKVLGSMRVQKDNGIVSFSFPKNLAEELSPQSASMAGYLFESECYFALLKKGLKDLTEKRFDTERYKKQKDALADVYVDIVNAARELADAMYNAAIKVVGHVDAVKYLGGSTGLSARGDTADIQLSSVGYSLKYKGSVRSGSNVLNLASMSVKNIMRLFGVDVDKNDPDILNKIKEGFEKATTPEKFTQLLNYFITGGGDTYLASYQTGIGSKIGHPEVFSNNFDIVNHELRGKTNARVTTDIRSIKKKKFTSSSPQKEPLPTNNAHQSDVNFKHAKNKLIGIYEFNADFVNKMSMKQVHNLIFDLNQAKSGYSTGVEFSNLLDIKKFVLIDKFRLDPNTVNSMTSDEVDDEYYKVFDVLPNTNEALIRREYQEGDKFGVYLIYQYQNTISLYFYFDLNKWISRVKLSWK
jgi:hypothetical protein